MSNNISEEIRQTLMESAAWDRVGLEPKFLNEDDDGEEAPAEEEAADGEAPAEEEAADGEAEEEVSEEELSEALATLLSMMSDDQLLEHIENVLSVVDRAAEVLEEEEVDNTAN